eukprot:PhF_6_TR19131/c0_g1_i1/m.28140
MNVADLLSTLNQSKKDEASEACKDALTECITSATKSLSLPGAFTRAGCTLSVTWPAEESMVAERLKSVGLDNFVELWGHRTNVALEAVCRSGHIRDVMIQSLSTLNTEKFPELILSRDSHACVDHFTTQVFSNAVTYVYPHVKEAMETSKANTLWTEVYNQYYSIPFVKKGFFDVHMYVTTKVVEAYVMFMKQAEKELRADPSKSKSVKVKSVFSLEFWRV